MTGTSDEVHDNLLPNELGPGWMALHVAAAAWLTAIGGSAWALVYGLGMTSDEVAAASTTVPVALQPVLIVALYGGLVAQPLVVYGHNAWLSTRGAALRPAWYVVALVGLQLWPLQWAVVYAFWRRRREAL